MNGFLASRAGIIVSGAAIGVLAALLQLLGNPANMGICVACFSRDTAGAIGLHRFAPCQYIRPELVGFVLGSLFAAWAAREFRARAGSAPVVRFLLGVFAAIGALVFLGCPWRALLRFAGGDMNSAVGLAGLAIGVWIAVGFFKKGFSLGRSHQTPTIAGLLMPAVMLLLLGLLVFRASFGPDGALFFSEKGPGAAHARIRYSLAAGLVVGVLAQRTRFCTMGAIRDVILIRDWHLLSGVVALALSALIVNVCSGNFRLGMANMPIAHSNTLWSFLGMVLSGLCFCLAGGCPGRQFFLAGEGDGDAAIFCGGLIVGAAIAHNWLLTAAPDAIAADGAVLLGGPGVYGKIAVLAGIAFCLLLGFTARPRAGQSAQSLGKSKASGPDLCLDP